MIQGKIGIQMLKGLAIISYFKGPLVISMKISPSRVEKYFIFSTFLDGT